MENYKKNLDTILQMPLTGIILIILPVVLLTGSFLSDLVVSIIAISGLIILFRVDKKYLFLNKFLFIFFVYSIYLILLSLKSDYVYLSFESSLFYIRFILFSFGVFSLIKLNKEIQKYFFYSFFLAFVFLFLDSLIQYTFNYNILGMKLVTGRVSSFFGEELIMGSFVSRLMPLMIGGLLLLNIKKFKNIFLSSFFIISLILVILSGERTALFNFLFFIIFFIFFGKYKINKLKPLFYLSIIFVSLVFVFEKSILDRGYTGSLNYRFLNLTSDQLFSDTLNGKKLNFYSETHENLAITSINIWNDNILFGSGPKTFRKECSKDRILLINRNQLCGSHPHNIFFQLLAETGTIGILFYLLFISILIIDFLKLIKQKTTIDSNLYNFKLCLIISIFITIMPFIPGPNFYGNYINILFYLPMGFYMYYFNKIR